MSRVTMGEKKTYGKEETEKVSQRRGDIHRKREKVDKE